MEKPSSAGGVERFFEKAAGIIIFLLMSGLIAMFFYLLIRFTLIKPASQALVIALPIIWVGAFWLILKFPKSRLLFALTAISIILPLYIFELYQSFRKIDLAFFSKGNKGIAEDTRTDMEVLRDLQAQGKDATVFTALSTMTGIESQDIKELKEVFPMRINGKEIIPLSAQSLKPTILCNEDGSWIVYQSDEQGFNNPKGLYNPGKVDMALLGDSFVHGYCVAPDKNLSALLRKAYPGTINFGVGGAGTLTRFAIFKEYIQALRPKTVLYIYTDSTLSRIQNEGRLKIYLNKGFQQHLSLLQPQLDEGYGKFVHALQDYWQHTNQLGFELETNLWVRILTLKNTRDQIGFFWDGIKEGDNKKKMRDGDLALLRQTLREIGASTQSWGGQMVFVYLYTPFQSAISDHDMILPLVRNLSIPAIDLYGIFDDVKNPVRIYSKQGGHLNEYGYARVADGIIKGLESLHAKAG